MKKHILLLILLAFSSKLIYSQNYNQELLKSYSKKELKEISKSNPNEIKLLNYAIDNACYVVEKPVADKKIKSTGQGRTITLPVLEGKLHVDLDKIKFTDFGFKIKDENIYIILTDYNKMLVVKSKWVLQNELDQIK